MIDSARITRVLNGHSPLLGRVTATVRSHVAPYFGGPFHVHSEAPPSRRPSMYWCRSSPLGAPPTASRTRACRAARGSRGARGTRRGSRSPSSRGRWRSRDRRSRSRWRRRPCRLDRSRPACGRRTSQSERTRGRSSSSSARRSGYAAATSSTNPAGSIGGRPGTSTSLDTALRVCESGPRCDVRPMWAVLGSSTFEPAAEDSVVGARPTEPLRAFGG